MEAKRGAPPNVDGDFLVRVLAVILHRASLNRSAERHHVPGAWLRSSPQLAATAQVVPTPAATPTSSKVLSPAALTHHPNGPLSEEVPPITTTTTATIPDALHEPFMDQSAHITPHSSLKGSTNACDVKTPKRTSSGLLCRSGSGVKSKQKGRRAAAGGPFDSITGALIKDSVVRLLQNVVMFLSPMHTWRYRIPAMSMSFNASCIVEAETQRLVTFGSQSASVPTELRCRGCVAGDTFIAVVTDKNEVWISGSLDAGNGSITASTDNMRGIATRSLMISGRGSRLLSLTKGFTVRPLSVISANTRSVFPSRLVRFLDVGLGDDCYMVGVDSVIYKTTINQRNISTPRRVMTLSRTPIARVASGMSFHIFIDEAGRVFTVGRNKKGQLGNGKKQDTMRRPQRLDSLSHHYAIQVAAGESHSLVLTSSGDVYGAGSNEYGQLGLGPNTADVCSMTRIPLPAKCTGIAAGPLGSMFSMDDGRIFTCGFNDVQQLGLGPENDTQRTVMVPTCISRTLVQHGVFMDDVNVAQLLKPPADSAATIVSPGGDSTTFALSHPLRGTPLVSSRAGGVGSRGSSNFSQHPKTNTLCKKCCSVM